MPTLLDERPWFETVQRFGLVYASSLEHIASLLKQGAVASSGGLTCEPVAVWFVYRGTMGHSDAEEGVADSFFKFLEALLDIALVNNYTLLLSRDFSRKMLESSPARGEFCNM